MQGFRPSPANVGIFWIAYSRAFQRYISWTEIRFTARFRTNFGSRIRIKKIFFSSCRACRETPKNSHFDQGHYYGTGRKIRYNGLFWFFRASTAQVGDFEVLTLDLDSTWANLVRFQFSSRTIKYFISKSVGEKSKQFQAIYKGKCKKDPGSKFFHSPADFYT